MSSPDADIAPEPPEEGFLEFLWQHLDGSFAPSVELWLQDYIRKLGCSDWIIATDFCIEDEGRPNDSFAYMILPTGRGFYQRTLGELDRLPQKDIKQVRSPPREMIRFLRQGYGFGVCFVADRKRKMYPDVEALRASLDFTIAGMEAWTDAAHQQGLIAKYRAARQEAAKKTVSLRLFDDITLASALASYLGFLLCKHSGAASIAWVPDRDKITESYGGLAQSSFHVNLNALCLKHGLKVPAVHLYQQTNENLWCDKFIRVADYMAAAGAAWDPPHLSDPHSKILKLLRGAFNDNQNLHIMRLAYANMDGRQGIQVHRLAASRRPTPGYDHRNVKPLLGRSRKLGDE